MSSIVFAQVKYMRPTVVVELRSEKHHLSNIRTHQLEIQEISIKICITCSVIFTLKLNPLSYRTYMTRIGWARLDADNAILLQRSS